ncbi:helix-turn-helix transcriptional regulator [Streptomyces sp. ISL-100]|uniref:helix-turn-helix domain-containing protein n=1 Tax=Streptomyces sp. ISL-100 TaxID=2819173 RepID=UPI001BEA6C1D|nr:helix-turn-helix transcriptional regulator [Streptomyces sp. ISL-100]
MFNRHHFTARRIALGLSVEELADELQVSPSTIYRWESGATCPSLRMLVPVTRHSLRPTPCPGTGRRFGGAAHC